MQITPNQIDPVAAALYGAGESAVGAEELARRLGVSTETVRGLAAERKIPHFKINQQYRFDVDAVLRALAIEANQ